MRGEMLRRWGWVACALVASACGFTGPGQAVTTDAGVDAPLPPAIVNFAADMSTEDEMSGAIQVEVTLSRPATSRITVPYRIVPNAGEGWATAGDDFAGSDGMLTFEPGDSIAGIDLAIVADSNDEDNEKIEIELQAPTGDAMLGTTTTHTLTINAFFLPRVGFMTPNASGGENTTNVQLALTLSPAPTSQVTVGYTISGDAEYNGSGFDDHNLVAGNFTIPAGTTSIAIPVTITNDTFDEDNEHVIVTLTSSLNAVIDQARTTHDYTINDDDNPPSISFQTASTSLTADEGSASTDITLVAQLSGRSEKMISVQFGQNTSVTDPATATADFTYQTASPLTWAPGAGLTKNITVRIVEDLLDEEDEILETTFSNPSNATIAANTKSTITIVDNDAAPTVGWMADLGDIGETDSNHSHDFTAVLSAASAKTVTVQVTVTGSAIYDDPSVGGTPSDWDFTTAANHIPIVFAPGTTTKKVTITIRGDNTDEAGDPNRDDAKLMMSSATNATIDTGSDEGDFVIVDDD
ncbi:MAG: Calx-beta domain-containing protein [Kofleriaceae bacterium]|nr:Calx-beta domain-containing protein [Kofleriaceae bacterium]